MKRAFTLIEMLAASALAAALMVALLSVCGTIKRSERAMAAHRTSAPESAMIEMLRRDLAQSQTVSITGDTLTMTGHGGLDRSTLQTGHQPVRITYRLERAINDVASASRGVLVREQADLLELTNRNTWRELFAFDVSEFHVERVQSSTTGNATSPANEAVKPTAVRVDVHWNDTTRPVLSAILFAR